MIEQLSGIRTSVNDPWMIIFENLGQQELQPHQDALIQKAEELLSGIVA